MQVDDVNINPNVFSDSNDSAGMSRSIHFPSPIRESNPDAENLIIFLGVFLSLVIGAIVASFVPGCMVPAIIPITITLSFIIPTWLLALLGYRSVFDVWVGISLIALNAYVIAAIILLNLSRYDLSYVHDVPHTLYIVAWSIVPVIPLMYAGYRWSLRSRNVPLRRYRTVNYERMRFLGVILFIIGLVARFIYEFVLGGDQGVSYLPASIGVYVGSILVVADAGNIGLIMIMFTYMVKCRSEGGQIAHRVFLFQATLLSALVMIGLNFMRGSRFHMIVFPTWIICLYSIYVKKISMTKLLLILFFAIPFLTLYKVIRFEGFHNVGKLVFDSKYRQSVQHDWNLGVANTLVGDFSRYGTWLVYYDSFQPGGSVDFQYGKTYLAAILQPIPRFIYRNKAPGMVRVSIDAYYGRGIYDQWRAEGRLIAAPVGGLWGEGYANLGFLGVWFSALIFGVIIGKIKKLFIKLPFDSIAFFLYPIAFGIGPGFILGDLRLITWSAVRLLIVVIPLLWFISDPVELFYDGEM